MERGFIALDLKKAKVQRISSRRSDSWRRTIVVSMDVQHAFDNGTLSDTVRDMDTNATWTGAILTERV